MKKINALIFVLLISIRMDGAIRSTTGNIYFKSNSSGNIDANLSTIGLGLGVLNPSANLHVSGNMYISDRLSLGTSTSGNSTLNINGSVGYTPEVLSSSSNIGGNSTVLANTASGNIILNLPYAGNTAGKVYTIKKMNTRNLLWVNGSSNYIDTYTSLELGSSSPLPSVELMSNGSQWYILSYSGSPKEIGSDNLIGWWKFDETGSTTTAIDAMGSDNTGTVSNLSSWGNGKIDGALHLGATTYVGIGSATDYSYMPAITLSAWIYHNGNLSDKAIIDKFWDNTNRSFLLWLQSIGGVLKIVFKLGSDVVANAEINGNEVTANTWHHVAGTWSTNDSTMRSYLNGELQGTTAMSGNYIRVNTTVPRIGNALLGGSNNKYFGAGGGTNYIDDARIYNRALTGEEIKSLYNAGVPR